MIFSMLIALCLCAPLPGLAESFDRHKMQRDLEIAEGILSRLQGVEAGPPFQAQARGIYLKGYGVLFLSQGMGRELAMLRMMKGRGEEDLEVEVERPVHSKGDTSSTEFAEFKEQTGEFFRSYAHAIGQLGEDERLTVLSGDLLGSGMWGMMRGKRMGMRQFLQKAPGDSGAGGPEPRLLRKMWKQPAPGDSAAGGHEAQEIVPLLEAGLAQEEERAGVFFEATVKKSDLNAYRRGKLSEEDLQNRILYREHQPDPQVTKKIDIMAGILEKVLTRGPRPGWGPGRGGFGIYHEGIGAVFYVDGGIEGIFVARAMGRRFGEPHLTHAQAGEERAQLKEEVITAIAEYGHTLPLKPQEQAMVEVRWAGAGRLLFKARKEDLDAYRKGTLSLDQFRQKVEVEE